ncbi:hypothetical protein MtrunA17_Chr7g0240771 [Medicago truncatula]|uniref:Uncharacterized protein n=1 Tax=Medicago truncatula TaxID=3880 RepID=A0A072TK54_MEDTR|nr:uncharacterized protein LOC25479766 [Medicago truncatula]KEH17273.1 hypothetical protein MTR_0027s0090 [Medicago truncatula]RHN46299.1 hypothetical protein MtrunA17_Chr7g0240771 [Medicago truncatula]
MAENLDDGEFWLPPQFLSDDDGDDTITTKAKPSSFSLFNNGEDPLLFPYGFACSDLSSPIDSLAASSETESDDDEQLFAELTRCLSRSSLHVDSKASENHNNNNNLGGSPQSTLCAFDSKCRKGSSQGSSNGVCDAASSNATLNLLHAAAGEVETLRLNQQTVPQRNSSPVTLPKNNAVSPNDLSFFAPQSISHYQLQIANLQRMRQQQIAERLNTIREGMQRQNGGVFQQRQTNGRRNNNVAGLGLSSSAWPTLQHAQQQQPPIHTSPPCFPMGAVFHGNGYGSSTGTGVFLPRPVESRNSPKKPACTTAYVPARVAHALNLKLEDYIVGCQPHRFNSTSNVENVAAVAPPRHRGNNVNSQKKRSNNTTSRPQPAAVSNEIKLPQEWTY